MVDGLYVCGVVNVVYGWNLCGVVFLYVKDE